MCGTPRSLQATHLVELVGEAEHDVGGQGVVLLVLHVVLANYLHDVLLLVEQVVSLERERSVRPALRYGSIEDDLVVVVKAVAVTRLVAAVGTNGP